MRSARHRVVIVGADLVALELAEFLAARGRLVSVLESDKMIAPELGNKRKTEHMDRLDRLGVAMHVRAPVDKIVPDGVIFTPYGGTSRLLAADSVVIAGTLQPNTELYEKLVAALPNVFNALKIAAPAAFLGAVLGEYLGGVDSGLGILITAAQTNLRYAQLWALALLSGAIAGAGYLLVGLVAKLVAPWSATGERKAGL